MDQQVPLQIEVSISSELRVLVASHSSIGDQSVQATGQIVDALDRRTPQTGLPVDTTPLWQTITLRQDGNRPAQFAGIQLLKFSEDVSIADIQLRHDISIYLSHENEMLVSLALTPPQSSSVRPIHQMANVTKTTVNRCLESWFEITCQTLTRIRQNNQTALSVGQVETAFHAITSHCFQAARWPTERTTK
jgi:hypothetical protein